MNFNGAQKDLSATVLIEFLRLSGIKSKINSATLNSNIFSVMIIAKSIS